MRIEIENKRSKFLLRKLKEACNVDDHNIFETDSLINLNDLWHIVNHTRFKTYRFSSPAPVIPLGLRHNYVFDPFRRYRSQDVLLHHPYNSMEELLNLLEASAEDPKVLAIKITAYRVAKDSRVINALLKAAENGKNVSVLFELKARFDEENNIREANRLQKAGCFVIHGVSNLKTHTKVLLIVRKEDDKIRRYVHISSGNYNEDTSKIYTDIAMITSDERYANDVSEFFNAITGHSKPKNYKLLVTAPGQMRREIISLIRGEIENASQGLPSGIVIKVNSLQDAAVIDALYKASQAGVPIRLIVRGMCCIRPGRKGLSENIRVYSIVGDYLEHSRILYFHNGGDSKILAGSADVMVRSFDRRIESLFFITVENCKQEIVNILHYNLMDNVNAWEMMEDGSYERLRPQEGENRFNCQRAFFKVGPKKIWEAKLF